jgi:hypothetical protein
LLQLLGDACVGVAAIDGVACDLHDADVAAGTLGQSECNVEGSPRFRRVVDGNDEMLDHEISPSSSTPDAPHAFMMRRVVEQPLGPEVLTLGGSCDPVVSTPQCA